MTIEATTADYTLAYAKPAAPAINSVIPVSTENISQTGNPEFTTALKTASVSKTDLDAIFEAAGEKYNINADFLKAVAKAESNFQPNATSPKGAMGIMQLMPGTAKGLGVTDAYDPEQNIFGGAKFLRQMLDKFNGDPELALAAYNAGPGAVTKYNGIPPYSETQNYVKTVMGYFSGGALSAGSVTYSPFSGKGRYFGRNEKTDEQASLNSLGESLSQMLLMKIIDMQMNALKDDKKKVY